MEYNFSEFLFNSPNHIIIVIVRRAYEFFVFCSSVFHVFRSTEEKLHPVSRFVKVDTPCITTRRYRPYFRGYFKKNDK